MANVETRINSELGPTISQHVQEEPMTPTYTSASTAVTYGSDRKLVFLNAYRYDEDERTLLEKLKLRPSVVQVHIVGEGLQKDHFEGPNANLTLVYARTMRSATIQAQHELMSERNRSREISHKELPRWRVAVAHAIGKQKLTDR